VNFKIKPRPVEKYIIGEFLQKNKSGKSMPDKKQMTEHQKLLANMCHIEDYIAKQRLEHHRMVVSNFNNDGNHNPIQRRM